MSENNDADLAVQLLKRLPGAVWSSRVDPATMSSEWLYVGHQMATIVGVPEEEMRRDPLTLLKRILPEDAAPLEQQFQVSLTTLELLSWTGRLVHTSGAIRWIEMQIVFERQEGGAVLTFGHALDVTDQKQAELLRGSVLDALPVGVSVSSREGKLIFYNAAQKRASGRVPVDGDPALMRSFGGFKADGVTPLPEAERPSLLTLADGEMHETEMVVKNPYLPAPIRLHVKASPVRDVNGEVYAVMTVTQNITEQRRLEDELRARNAELAESEGEKTALIDRLRYAIDELSNPILEVWDDVLAMPIIGVVDSRRTADMVQRLLAEVARTQASFVIVDLTGVELVDTKTADYLMKLIRKVELIGARCVLTGIRPAVAETLVDIGVDFGRLTTLRNLKHGLREALRFARREREGLRSLHLDEGLDEGELEAVAGKR